MCMFGSAVVKFWWHSATIQKRRIVASQIMRQKARWNARSWKCEKLEANIRSVKLLAYMRYSGPIYKKKSQLLRYIYCLKNFSNPHLMFVLLIIVGIFNTSFKKLQQLMIILVLMIFDLSFYKKDWRK